MSKSNFKIYANLALISQIGIMTALPIVGGVYIGKYLDEKFGSNGLILLVFIVFGVVSSFYQMIRFTIKKSQRDVKQNEKERKERNERKDE
ncbi:MAG: AtpZ/AtpI family protein [Acidaminobacteraceae bacterium]